LTIIYQVVIISSGKKGINLRYYLQEFGIILSPYVYEDITKRGR